MSWARRSRSDSGSRGARPSSAPDRFRRHPVCSLTRAVKVGELASAASGAAERVLEHIHNVSAETTTVATSIDQSEATLAAATQRLLRLAEQGLDEEPAPEPPPLIPA